MRDQGKEAYGCVPPHMDSFLFYGGALPNGIVTSYRLGWSSIMSSISALMRLNFCSAAITAIMSGKSIADAKSSDHAPPSTKNRRVSLHRINLFRLLVP